MKYAIRGLGRVLLAVGDEFVCRGTKRACAKNQVDRTARAIRAAGMLAGRLGSSAAVLGGAVLIPSDAPWYFAARDQAAYAASDRLRSIHHAVRRDPK